MKPSALLTQLFLGCALLGANIPAEGFFRPSQFSAPQISPDGKQVAFIAHEGWKGFIGVIELATKKIRMFEPAKLENAAWVRWASNERLIFGLTVNYEWSTSSTVYSTGGFYAVGKDGGKVRELFRWPARLLHTLPHDADHILVAFGAWDSSGNRKGDGVYLVNIHTGAQKLVQEPFGNVREWQVDRDGEVRLAFALEDDREDVLYRPKGGAEFSKLRSLSLNAPDFSVIGFDDANGRLWVVSDEGRDTSALFAFDPKRQELGSQIFAPEGYDFSGSLRTVGQNQRPLGIQYVTDKERFHALDPAEAEFQAKLDRFLPNTVNRVASQSLNGEVCIIAAESDTQPGRYILCRRSPFDLSLLGEETPWLKPAQLSPMKPIQYAARDGLTIHGYLTTPVTGTDAKPPLVVIPHGGPWVRDVWGYDPEVQFLASRGYAVLQINFRGSSGYGQSFLEAGYKQWGRKMQDDLTDGVKWAIGQGHADPERVGIYGASYGGYAAMSGLCFTPELYRCGVSMCGVTDMRTFIRGIPKKRHLLRDNMEKMVGDPKVESDEMKASSPQHNIGHIQVPVLLAYGREDPIVDIKHGDRFARELRKQGKAVTYLTYPNEGHGFFHRDNKLNFYAELERFLDKHLKSAKPRSP